VNQLLQKAVVVESRYIESRDAYRTNRSNSYVIESYFYGSDDESRECYATEFFFSRTRRRAAYHCINRRRESYIDPNTHPHSNPART